MKFHHECRHNCMKFDGGLAFGSSLSHGENAIGMQNKRTFTPRRLHMSTIFSADRYRYLLTSEIRNIPRQNSSMLDKYETPRKNFCAVQPTTALKVRNPSPDLPATDVSDLRPVVPMKGSVDHETPET